MPWSKEDKSFKTLINKRATSSTNRFYEEVGDNTLDISFSEVRTESVPSAPPVDTTSVVKKYTLLSLTLNNEVLPSNTSFYAKDPLDPTASTDGRLRNWISDKYGAGYSIVLYDSNNNVIPVTHASEWIFDYMTGILSFNGDMTSLPSGGAGGFKIKGYRYIGKMGVLKGLNTYQTITFSALKNLVTNNALEAGAHYLLSDFVTVHKIPGYTTTTLQTGDVEPLLLCAKDENSFYPEVYSLLYDQDIIRYDFTNQLVEDGVTPRKGKILYREDTILSISAYYDWRNVAFNRWVTTAEPNIHYAEQALAGASPSSYRSKTFDLTKTVRNIHLPPTTLYDGYNNVVFKENVTNNHFTTSVTGSTFLGNFTGNTIENCKLSVFREATDNKMGNIVSSFFIGTQTYRSKVEYCYSTKIKSNFNDNNVFKLNSVTVNSANFTGNTLNRFTNIIVNNDWTEITLRLNVADITITQARYNLIFDYLVNGKFISLTYNAEGNLDTSLYTI